MNPINRVTPIIAGVAVLLAISLLAFATKPWWRFTDNDEVVAAVAEVTRDSRPLVFHFSGELQPAAEVDVVSRVAGKLTEVKFKTGDRVSAGTVVATVYSGELTERVRLVETELNATRKQLREREQQAADADQRLARLNEFYRQDLIARRDVEQAETQAATARAELELTRAQIAQAQAMLMQTRKLQQLARIIAPISGLVTGALSPGVPVNEARAILTIAQIDTLKLTGAMPEHYAQLVHAGMEAQVSARPGSAAVRNGEVIRIVEKFKSVGAAEPIEIRIDNRDHALQLGAMATAALTLKGHEQLLTIPSSALQSAADQYYVYQIVNGRATRRRVELDASNTEPAVIRAGLKAGDLVIADRPGAVREGMRVRVAARTQ